jgi:hypothetical protein
VKIKLNASRCGEIEGRKGQVIDVPDEEAARLIAAGEAEPFEDLAGRVAALEAAVAELKKARDEAGAGGEKKKPADGEKKKPADGEKK